MIWPLIHDERRALIGDLVQLSAEQWGKPSLCPGWDVHDVVAHIVDTARTTRLEFLRRMVAAGFDFDKDNARGVERERAEDPRHTLEELRAVASRTTGPPAPLPTRLVESFVHGEDIRRPLGIRREYPRDAVVEALKLQVATSTKIGGGKELVDGLTLVVSEAGIQHGQGPEVRGTAIALLLAVSSRPVGSRELSGPGAVALMARSGS